MTLNRCLAVADSPVESMCCQSAGEQAGVVNEFIENRFKSCFDATIKCNYPRLLAVQDGQGRCLAAAGYRGPEHPFFLEQYLDRPAEVHLSSHSNGTVNRELMVEVGNLTGINARAVYLLLDSLWSVLSDQQYHYVMLTATAQIRNRLRGMPYWKIATAKQQELCSGENWGSYYENSPWVIAGQLRQYDNRYKVQRRRGDIGHTAPGLRNWTVVELANRMVQP